MRVTIAPTKNAAVMGVVVFAANAPLMKNAMSHKCANPRLIMEAIQMMATPEALGCLGKDQKLAEIILDNPRNLYNLVTKVE